MTALRALRVALDEAPGPVYAGDAYGVQFDNTHAQDDALEFANEQAAKSKLIEFRMRRTIKPVRLVEVEVEHKPAPAPKSNLGNELIRAPVPDASTWIMTYDF